MAVTKHTWWDAHTVTHMVSFGASLKLVFGVCSFNGGSFSALSSEGLKMSKVYCPCFCMSISETIIFVPSVGLIHRLHDASKNE